MRTEVRFGAVANKGGLGFATLVVQTGVEVVAVFAAMQVRPAVRTGVAPSDLDSNLDLKNLFVPAGVTKVRHGGAILGPNNNEALEKQSPVRHWGELPDD